MNDLIYFFLCTALVMLREIRYQISHVLSSRVILHCFILDQLYIFLYLLGMEYGLFYLKKKTKQQFQQILSDSRFSHLW